MFFALKYISVTYPEITSYTLFTEQQIEKLAPKDSTFKAGKKLGVANKWDALELSERAMWGSIKGSGKKPYLVQVDTKNIAYKCTCPSRQFPCKHAVGILLVHSVDSSAFTKSKEPDYVEDWISKREKRADKINTEEKELTEEEKEKKSTAKAKRQDDKLKLTLAGIAELKLWLKDMIRIGILELPNRPAKYFETMMERMVDSKAQGLAGWIKALKNLPYKNQDQWQDQALDIIAKLFLLVKATENLDKYSEAEQKAIKGLLGWTYKQKEMSSDQNNISIKDSWLVLGSHSEIQEELTINRYWLIGLKSEKDALIIRFHNQYTAAELIPIVEGSIIEAELSFYPGLDAHRAFIKKQKEVHQSLAHELKPLESWNDYQIKMIAITQKDPWSNNRAGIIDQVKILRDSKLLMAVDRNKNYKILSSEMDEDKISTLLLNTTGEPTKMAFANRQDGILPLGLFMDNKYQVL